MKKVEPSIIEKAIQTIEGFIRNCAQQEPDVTITDYL